MGWLAAFLLVIGGGFLASSYNQEPIDPLQAYVIIEDGEGHGSGVFVSPTQVLTAKHVTEHITENMHVRGPEGDLYQIIGVYDGPADIAIIEVDRPLRGTPLGISCEPLSRGDKLHYYGSPLNIEFLGPIELEYVGGTPKVSPGLPEEIVAEQNAMADSALLVNGEAEPGASGSGILDSQNRVVGVYNFAWDGTTLGGFISLSFPAVCAWLMKELHHNAVGQEVSNNLEDQAPAQDHL